MNQIIRLFALCLYYGIAQHLPVSYNRIFGKLAKRFRYSLCRLIFLKIGENVNIERKANFGNGKEVIIGSNSGLGINCVVPNNIVIGDNVMMGPNCYILDCNHIFEKTDIPIQQQGSRKGEKCIIESDVWIGRNVMFTSGRRIRQGTIIGMGAVVTKDFPAYTIIGGNPAKLIRSRL